MTALNPIVVFGLDAHRYALPLAVVVRIIHAVEVTPLPSAPAVVLGVIDVAGQVIPVLNLRRYCSLPERALCPADQFLIANTSRRTVALVVDETFGVVGCPASAFTPLAHFAPGPGQLQGILRLDDGLILIHDLEQFLSPEETHLLAAAMNPEVLHAH